MRIREVCVQLESVAPLRLAEEWDNVGLLVGDADHSVNRIMTCLTVTPATVEEAIQRNVDLVVSHHPFPFHKTKRITTEDTVGRMLWRLIRNQISVYSPHTAWDSAQDGINQQLARAIELSNVVPLRPLDDDPDQLGSGRIGDWSAPRPLADVIQGVKTFLQIDHLQFVGDAASKVQRAAIACGAAGEFLGIAHQRECDLLVLGETSFHTCLEAEALGVALILTGHFASERFSLDGLAVHLSGLFPTLEVWSSATEKDPVQHA